MTDGSHSDDDVAEALSLGYSDTPLPMMGGEAPPWLSRAAERIEQMQACGDAGAEDVERIVLEELKADEPGTEPTYVAKVSRQVREMYGVPDDTKVADNVTLKLTVLHADHRGVHFVSPAILHEFKIGGETDDDENHVVVKVCFIAPPDAMRDYAKLAFDAARNVAAAGEGQMGESLG